MSSSKDHDAIIHFPILIGDIGGPVDSDEIHLTNCPWIVRPKQMIKDFFLDDVIVLNDFEAQALAAASLDTEHRHAIGGGKIEHHASRVVLGPGTGLGVAGLVYSRHSWIPVPGEGGHIDLGPRTDRDFAIFPHLKRIGGRVSAEQILCGSGLVNLYTAICKAAGWRRPGGERSAFAFCHLSGARGR